MHVPLELKLKYLNRRIQDIQNLRALLEQDDFTFAIKLGHQLKGNAVTFDFPHLAIIGIEIENAGKNSDKDRVKVLVHQMEDAIYESLESFSELALEAV